MKLMIKLSPLLTAVLIASCSTVGPVAEVRNVANAFDSLNAASQPLLDDLAIAEREQGKQNARTRARSPGAPLASGETGCNTQQLMPGTNGAPDLLSGFCTSDSAYYVDLIDPPATAEFRQGLAVLGSYTDVLTTLAEGDNLPAAQAELQNIASHVVTLGSVVGIAGTALSGAVKAFSPLLERAGQQANWKQLRVLVLDYSDEAETVAQALKDTAPELFNTLTQNATAQYSTAVDNPEVAAMYTRQVEVYRVAVSQYVVLLGDYLTLLQKLNTALQSEPNTASFSYLAQRAGELAATSDAWRRSLAALRANPAITP